MAAVEARVIALIETRGRHEFIKRLLDGSLNLTVDTPAGRRTVNVVLDLGDLRDAHHVQGIHAGGYPVGTKRHHAVEADQELVTSTRRTATSSRLFSLSGNALIPFGHLPGAAWSATVGAGLTGSSSVSYENGLDGVVAVKLAPRYEGLSAWFDFPTASIQTFVTEGPLERTGRTDITARAAFPEELAPVKTPQDPPGAYREQRRTLGPPLGRSQHDLETMRTSGGADAAAAIEKNLEGTLHHFLHIAESADDMADLREAILTDLYGTGQRDEKVADFVRDVLSEEWSLKRWGDVTASGALTPQIIDSKGRSLGMLKIKAGLRTAQASAVSKLGLKEEVQRFISVWDSKKHSGGATLAVPTVSMGHVIGDPTAALGGYSNISFGGELAFSMSSSRSHDVNTGSGDIRGTVIWGDSVEYDAKFHVTAKLIRPNGRTIPHQGTLPVNLRIPKMQRARFEHKLRTAAGESLTDPEPVEDEPDTPNSVRYPPAVITANQGIGFASPLFLPGAQDVLPRTLEMIKAADGPLAWAKNWNAFDEAFLESQLSSRFTLKALKAHAGALFQPGGTSLMVYRPARNGVEAIKVTVEATHEAEPAASGRVASSTLEAMPSAFAGNAGTDEIAARFGGFFQVNGFKGLGSQGSREPRTVGGKLQAGGNRAHTVATTAGVSGFTLQANLYGEQPGQLLPLRRCPLQDFRRGAAPDVRSPEPGALARQGTGQRRRSGRDRRGRRGPASRR